MGARGPQKRPRKKPAPQAPRNVAIPVAMPKVPSVIPPRQPPPRAIEQPESGETNGLKLSKLKSIFGASLFFLDKLGFGC